MRDEKVAEVVAGAVAIPPAYDPPNDWTCKCGIRYHGNLLCELCGNTCWSQRAEALRKGSADSRWSYGWDGIDGVWFIPEVNSGHERSPHGLSFNNEATAKLIVDAVNAHNTEVARLTQALTDQKSKRPADRFWDCYNAETELDDALLVAFGIDPNQTDEWPFENICYDPYDTSFELHDAQNDFEPAVDHLAAAFALGFSRGWIVFKDGTEIFISPTARGARKPTPHPYRTDGKCLQRKLEQRLSEVTQALTEARQQSDESYKAWNRENELRRDAEEDLAEARQQLEVANTELNRVDTKEDLLRAQLAQLAKAIDPERQCETIEQLTARVAEARQQRDEALAQLKKLHEDYEVR